MADFEFKRAQEYYGPLSVALALAALVMASLALVHSMKQPGRENLSSAAPSDFSLAAKKVMPSLVKVENLALGAHPPIPLFGAQTEVPHTAEGAGFFIDKDGLILTNYHVVEGAQVLKVITRDQKEYTARVVGVDALTDLAVIKIQPDFDVIPVEFGDSGRLSVGQWVLAMGNPLGLEFFTSAGIISGFGPPGPSYIGIYDFIQIDANIEPGNSGGPLVDGNGRVVGVNNAYLGPGTGIGFSIPIQRAIDILPELKEKGSIARGFLGVVAQPITPGLKERLDLLSTQGALISEVQPGGPAAAAGLEPGDVVVTFNDENIKDDRAFYEKINTSPPNTRARLDVVRGGRRITLPAVLGELKPRAIFTQRVVAQCGITIKEVDAALATRLGLNRPGGLLVLKVIPGCPSFEAGLKFGDVIMRVEGQDVNTVEEFYRAYARSRPGSQVLLSIIRDKRPQFLTITQEGRQ